VGVRRGTTGQLPCIWSRVRAGGGSRKRHGATAAGPTPPRGAVPRAHDGRPVAPAEPEPPVTGVGSQREPNTPARAFIARCTQFHGRFVGGVDGPIPQRGEQGRCRRVGKRRGLQRSRRKLEPFRDEPAQPNPARPAARPTEGPQLGMAAQNPQPDPGQTRSSPSASNDWTTHRSMALATSGRSGSTRAGRRAPEERIEPVPDQRGLDGEVAEQAAPADPRRHGDVVHAGPVVAAGVEEPHRDERHRGGVDAGRSSPGDLLASLPTHPANYMAPSARIVGGRAAPNATDRRRSARPISGPSSKDATMAQDRRHSRQHPARPVR